MTKLVAISGLKNSGKTSFIRGLLGELKKTGLKIGVIKHDGHDFQPDLEGTDSYIHREAGADGVIVFSKNRWMLIREEERQIEDLLASFDDYDLVILEGFKNSNYPKFEVIRKANSTEPVTDKSTVLGYITDLGEIDRDIESYGLEDYGRVAARILEYLGLD